MKFIISSAFSLRCNACQSRESWDNCATNLTEKECTVKEARCVKYHYHMTNDKSTTQQKQLFARACVSQDQCSSSQLPACKDLEKSGTKMKITCHVSCCGEDLCNSQVTTSASVLIMMAMCLVCAFFNSLL